MRYGIRWNSVYPPFCRTFLSLSFFLIVRCACSASVRAYRTKCVWICKVTTKK